MGNAELNETREFGTGLRDYLALHGVRLDARVDPPSNTDLLELCTVTTQQKPARGVLTLLAATITA
jgi:hypothetical protein